jgi:hypothetical protein
VLAVSLLLVLGATAKVTSGKVDTSYNECPPGSPSIDTYRWCVRISPTISHPPVVVTAGDSTANMLDSGLVVQARKHLWRYVQAGESGCSILPMTGFEDDPACATVYATRVIRAVMASYHPSVWIVADAMNLTPIHEPSGEVIDPGDPRREPMIEEALRREMKLLTSQGAQVVLVSTPPKSAPAECGSTTTGTTCGDPSHRTQDPGHAQLDRIERKVASEMPGRVIRVSVTDILCYEHGRCPAKVDGMIARYDGVHYTGTFSRKIVPTIIARAKRAGARF